MAAFSQPISQSMLKTWRRCHQQFHYKYIQKLEPRKKAKPLVRGTIIHEMIDAHVNGADPFKVLADYAKKYAKLFREEREEYGDIVGEIDRLMRGYFKYYEDDPLEFIKIKNKRSEHELHTKIEGIAITLKVDALARSKNKRLWLVEHKSHKDIPTEDVRMTDLQTSIYSDIVHRELNMELDGILWNYIRAKAPTVPQLLKKGGLSKAKIDTTRDVYLAAIKEHKLKEADYRPILSDLVGKEKTFYRRVYMPVNRKMQRTLMADFLETAEDIYERAGKSTVRSIARECGWCSYRSLCQAELRGLDSKFVRAKEYQIRKREKEDGDEDEDEGYRKAS